MIKTFRLAALACVASLAVAGPAFGRPDVKLLLSFGAPPYALSSVTQACDGWFYGTSHFGGLYDEGTIFRMSPDGQFMVLRSLTGTPWIPPLQARDGWLYGATDRYPYKIRCDGSGFTQIAAFTPGDYALGALIQASDGNLYGTTLTGGSEFAGTIYRIAPDGTYSVFHNFTGDPDGHYRNGSAPRGGLVEGPDGNLYGTTSAGGESPDLLEHGVIYRITPAGVIR